MLVANIKEINLFYAIISNMDKIQMKEQTEIRQLEKFLKTEIGKMWYFENNIIDIQKSETPDFLLIVNNNNKIALELTEFTVYNKNLKYSQVLRRIGNQICKETENNYNLKISIIVDKYDKRKFSPNLIDTIDYAYNPGFSEIPPIATFKQELRKILKNNLEKLRKGLFLQEWIEINKEYFKISIEAFPNPWTKEYECTVNNSGRAEENPIDELQKCIANKNKKYEAYKSKADKCCLLIYMPDTRYSNYYYFDEKFFNYKFSSKFDQIFLYEEKTSKAINLRLTKNSSY